MIQATLLSLLPGIFWLWYVESHAPTRSRPLRLVMGLLGGALSCLGVLAVGELLDVAWPGVHSLQGSVAGQLIYFVFFVGLVEEFWKLLSVWLFVYWQKDFREPWDGLSASSCAALGFATAENAKYIMNFGAEVLIGRSVLATFGHVLMSGVWGFALGLQVREKRGLLVLEGLFWAALGHGLYDFFLMQGQNLAAVGVLLGLWGAFSVRIREAALQSTRRVLPVLRVRECGSCRALVREGWAFCGQCGKAAPSGDSYCEHCLAKAEPGAGSCVKCGRVFRGGESSRVSA